MTNQEATDFLSKEWGMSVSLPQTKEINEAVTNLAEIVVGAFPGAQNSWAKRNPSTIPPKPTPNAPNV